MRTAAPRSVALLLACWACAGLAQEPPAGVKKLAEALAAEQAASAKAGDKAKKDLLAGMAKLADAAARADRTELGKALQASLLAEREAFEKDGVLPESEEALPAVFPYAVALHKARPKLRQAQVKLAEGHAKAGDKEAEQAVRSGLRAFDDAEPGKTQFAAGSRWNGVLRKPNGATNVTLTFKEVNDKLAKGRLCLDNNWCQMEVEGLRDGPEFALRVKKTVVGGDQTMTFAGLVLGDRMVVQVNGMKGKKGTFTGLAVLTRANK